MSVRERVIAKVTGKSAPAQTTAADALVEVVDGKTTPIEFTQVRQFPPSFQVEAHQSAVPADYEENERMTEFAGYVEFHIGEELDSLMYPDTRVLDNTTAVVSDFKFSEPTVRTGEEQAQEYLRLTTARREEMEQDRRDNAGGAGEDVTSFGPILAPGPEDWQLPKFPNKDAFAEGGIIPAGTPFIVGEQCGCTMPHAAANRFKREDDVLNAYELGLPVSAYRFFTYSMAKMEERLMAHFGREKQVPKVS